MAEESKEQPTFNFGKGVVKNDGQALADIAAQLKINAKTNPPVENPPAEIAEPKKESAEEPAKPEEKPQTESEIETTEVPAVSDKKGKKGKGAKEEKKNDLPKIVGEDGKEIELPTYDENENNEFLESIGVKDKKETVVEGGKNNPKQPKNKETKAEVPKEVAERLAYLEQVVKDPAFNVAKELIGKGKDGLKELISKFDLTDYKTLPNKDIYEIDLKQQGLEGEELTEAMAEFEDLPSYKQKTITNPLRAKLQEKADESLNIASNAPTEKQVREQAKFQQEATENAIATLDDLCEKVSTKGYNGWKPKEEDLAIIRNGIESNTVVSMKDGKPYYDVKASFEREVWMNPEIRNKILKYSYEVGKFQGYEDLIKERVRVNPKDHIPGSQGGKPTYSFNNTVKPAQNGQN